MGAIPIHDSSATTTAPHWTPPQLSTSARTPSPSTTSACSSLLSSTGLLMEPFMFARLLAPATPESTLATSASRAEWVEAYLEDPIMIAEFRIYLEQNFCLS